MSAAPELFECALSENIMDSDEKGNEIVRRNKTDLLPHDVKEIDSFSRYANKQEHSMKQLAKDVDNMGKLKRIWDSKLPKKKLYHFFTLKESKPEEIKKEIQNYLEFYQQMSEVVCKLRSDEETENETDIYSSILNLYESLSDLATKAETGKKTTESSIVCDLHGNFIEKHEKLENMIKRVECVSLKQSWKKATDGLQQSLKAIDNLRSDLKTSDSKYDKMCDKFEELLTQNKTLINQQNFLLEENGKIMQQQQTLLEDNQKMKKQTDTLLEDNQKMKKQTEILIRVLENMNKEKNKYKKEIEKNDQN